MKSGIIRNTREKLIGWAGNKIHGYSLIIDIINYCPLRCPTCAVGLYDIRNKKRMSIETYRAILDKLEREGGIRKVQLYIYSDPCLHKDLHLFVQETVQRGIPISLSTMLQATACDFEKVIEARPTEFRISFAGWRNLHLYQKGGTIEAFLKKFETVTKLPHHKETRWTMYYHLYKGNLDEVERARQLAESHGVDFISYPAIFMPNELIVEPEKRTQEHWDVISLLLETPEENIKRLRVETEYCQMQSKQVCIDAEGTAYLCQIVYEDRFKIAPFLTTPLKEIRKAMHEHEFCKRCKACGGHTYQYLYSDSMFHKDPIARADKRRYA